MPLLLGNYSKDGGEELFTKMLTGLVQMVLFINYFASKKPLPAIVARPRDFREILTTSRIRVFFFFVKNSGKFFKKTLTIVMSKLFVAT